MKYRSFALTMASVCLFYGIGSTLTLAVPIPILPLHHQHSAQMPVSVIASVSGAVECDGCKWLVGKAQTYLKNNEPRFDNLTETGIETNVCAHFPASEEAYCNTLVERYVPVAFDALVTKFIDPALVCTEVVPLCSQARLFQHAEHRVKTPQTLSACKASIDHLSNYVLENSTIGRLASDIYADCKVTHASHALACENISHYVSTASTLTASNSALHAATACEDYVLEANEPVAQVATAHRDLLSSTDEDEVEETVNTGNRKLLLKVQIIAKSPPPPAPKPAPKLAPAPAPKPAPAPAPKAAPAPAPKPAPKAAPAPAPKPAPSIVVKAAPVVIGAAAAEAVLATISDKPAPAPTPAPTPMSIYITCDNEFDLYVNGKVIGRGTSWTTTYHFSPAIEVGDVIALDGVDRGGPAAFIGTFGGVVTKPADWKCSLKSEPGWNTNSFDDSKWAAAVSYSKNQDSNIWRSVGGGARPNIPGDAQWLWTSDNNNHDRVFCRFFPFGKVKPATTPAPTVVIASDEASPKTVARTIPKPAVATPANPASPVSATNSTSVSATASLPDSKPAGTNSDVKPATTVTPSPESVINEIIAANAKSNKKLTAFQQTMIRLMKETSDQQLKLEVENKKNFDGASVTLSTETAKLESEKNQLKKLYDESAMLNATIQRHYEQLITDTAYLTSLDKMKPEFFKSLDNIWGHVQSVKTTVSVKLVNDDYKVEMIRLLDDLHANAKNISGYVATAFINHYNKYKALINSEGSQYSTEMARLTALSADYKLKQQKIVDVEKSRARIQNILNEFKAAYELSTSQRAEFDALIKKIMDIFDNKKCVI